MKYNILRKAVPAALVLSMAGAMFTGCGTNKEAGQSGESAGKETMAQNQQAPAEVEKTKITFWTWTPTEAQFEDIKAAFDKAYPEVEIDWWRTAQMDDYLKKLQVSMLSGEGPDLFGMQPGGMLNQYSRFAEPMDKLADEYIGANWKEVISEAAVSQAVDTNGVQAGMPVITVGQEFMLYNKTLLDEAGVSVPQTYEELLAASKTLKEKGLIPVAMGAKDIWHDVDFFVALSQQFGLGKIYEAEKGNLAWTDQVFVDTMSAWKKLFDDGVFQDGALGVSTYPDARDQYFYERKTPFFPTGTWHVSAVMPNDETKGTKVEQDDIGMTIFPQMGPNPAASVTGVDFILAVNKDSKNKEAAMKFVNHMVMGEGQQIWINTLQGSPVNKNIKFTANDIIPTQTGKDSVAYITEMNANAVGKRNLDNAEIQNALGIAMQDIAAGKDILKALEEVEAISKDVNKK